jgi:hypothetical protein
MGRTRRTGARRSLGRRGLAAAGEAGGRLTIRRAAGLAASSFALLAPACTNLTTDLTVPVAIEIETPASPSIEQHDTLRLVVRVFDRGGDSIPGAAIRLAVLDTALLAVDSADQAVVGLNPGSPARVVALSGNLHSDPLTIVVLARADSVAATGATVDTLAESDSASAPLAVTVLDLHSVPGTATPLPARTVTFAIVLPAFASPGSATAVLANDSLVATATTAASGVASVRVKRKGAVQPDSVVVQAAARRASGASIPGSPVRFVVHF